MLGDVERTLDRLAQLDMDSEQVRQELRVVEAALERIRDSLYQSRWI